VKDHSLLAKDFKAGQLPAGARGLQGLQGPKGDTGPQGPKGDTGPQGPGARWALINPTGTAVIKSSDPGITVSHPFPGEYRVNFGVPTAGKLVMATLSERDNTGDGGAIESAPCGPAASATSDTYTNCAGDANTNVVAVITFAANNTTPTDRSFYVSLIG
jgi:hypothetical protein